MIQKLIIFLYLFSVVFAWPNPADKEKIEADIHKILSGYKENKNGFVEIQNKDEIKVYDDNVDENIKVLKYYEIVISPNERTTKSFPERRNFALVFRGDIDEYAVEITHKTKLTEDETFIPSQPIVVIVGNRSKHKFTVRVSRMPSIQKK